MSHARVRVPLLPPFVHTVYINVGIYNIMSYDSGAPKADSVTPVKDVCNLYHNFALLLEQEGIDPTDAFCSYILNAPYRGGNYASTGQVNINATNNVSKEKLEKVKTLLHESMAPWVITDSTHPANRCLHF